MLWEHWPQASVSTAFSSSPKLLLEHVFYFFEKTPRRQGKQEKENNLLTLIIKM